MKTFPTTQWQNRLLGFEFENIYVSRKAIAQILKSVEGVTEVQFMRRFGSQDERRLTFKYLGAECMVWEPYGDNSRYWVGSQMPSDESVDVTDIEKAFINYTPTLLRKLVGDILNLRLFRK